MANFQYVAKSREGKTIRKKEEALSKKELILRLQNQGFFIVSVKEEEKEKETGAAERLQPKKGKRKSVKSSDFTFLARNMATMLSSGVTLLRSLNIVASQTESLKLAEVLKKCSEGIRDGLSFEDAIRKYPNVFSGLWAGIIQVGEASGNLPSVLNRLADFLEMRASFESKIKGALIYPAILASVVVIAMGVFIKFIFPNFQVMFSQFDLELPALTAVVLGVADFLERNFFLFLGAFVAMVIAFRSSRKRPAVKEFLDKYILKVPIVGNAVFLACIERFTSVLQILLESGLPLVYSLDVAAKNIGNSLLESKLNVVTRKVRDGSSLSDELSRAGVFPTLVPEMTKVGEETGSMPDIFNKVSSYYRRELAATIDRVIAAFEPLMIIILGVVIGTIIVALLLPIFSLIQIR